MGKASQYLETKKPFLKMDHHFFPKVAVESCFDIPDGMDMDDFNDLDWIFGVEVRQDSKDPNSYVVKLEIKTDKKVNKAYNVQLNAIGFFHFTEDYPDPVKQGHMIYILGQNMLYGACREYLFTLTAHGPHPAIYLPTVTFIPEENGQQSLKTDEDKEK